MTGRVAGFGAARSADQVPTNSQASGFGPIRSSQLAQYVGDVKSHCGWTYHQLPCDFGVAVSLCEQCKYAQLCVGQVILLSRERTGHLLGLRSFHTKATADVPEADDDAYFAC